MSENNLEEHNSSIHYLWDCFCAISIIGIWPRYIEPILLSQSFYSIKLDNLPKDLDGLKIVQISDLHLSRQASTLLLNKLIKKIRALKPDLILLTGDFLCYSNLDDANKLRTLLQQFNAPYGCYAVLGNHDYETPVSVNSKGEYDLITTKVSTLSKGFSRLFTKTTLTGTTTERAKNSLPHQELVNLLKETHFQLLHNDTVTIQVKNAALNITGLGEYMLGKTNPAIAFAKYNSEAPGIILLHNPDGLPLLKNYPGDIVFCGHTHGGQINLPWLWKKFTLLENLKFKKGLFKYFSKWVNVNRGIGSTLSFRWFSVPEITLITLRS